MKYPYFSEIQRSRQKTTVFGGYNKMLSCEEGEFLDMKNMSSAYYPVLSPRDRRMMVKKLDNPLALLDKGSLIWIDGENIYMDGECIDLGTCRISVEETMKPKVLTKMGAYVVIMPDKIWYNTSTKESGYMEASWELETGKEVTFSMCDSMGKIIEYKDAEYYEHVEAEEGDYLMTTSNGRSSLKQYSATTRIWVSVATTYLQISAEGIGKSFKEGDGLTFTIEDVTTDWSDVGNIFVNKDKDGKLSTNAVISHKDDDHITITGITAEMHKLSGISFRVERKTPDIAFVTEYNNRLWACSKDGHEIYACKLGDVTNWNCFGGISTDSYAATIGSDGEFTGAVTYQGYPIFFKENSMIKVGVSGTGSHQIKETPCRGVQKGSERSITIVNEILYYKDTQGICRYNGSVPISISEKLGEVRYHDCAGGTINNRYYISMKDEKEVPHLFVYDTENGLWTREDNTDALYFCTYKDDLLFIDKKDFSIKSIRGKDLFGEGELEKDFEWMAESGKIGYQLPDQKYLAKISIRISLEREAHVEFYISYDSKKEWEFQFGMQGSGTRTYTIPIIPKRCDHLQYRIMGHGEAKIYGITKSFEQGSDVS